MQNESVLKDLEELAKKENLELFKISGVTGEGVEALINRVEQALKELPHEELIEEEERIVYTLEETEDFTVTKEGDKFVVEGKAVYRIMSRVNMDDNESLYYFHKCLEKTGINRKLKEMGIQEGDIVKMLDWEFEWYE